MLCFVPSETAPGETRAALSPASAQALVKLGLAVEAQPGLGLRSHYPDEAYRAAGVTFPPDATPPLNSGAPAAALARADLILRVRKPSPDAVRAMKPGALHLSFLDPFNEPELLAAFAAARVSAVSLEMIPRTTLAQKMDALSSQASLAGYAAVVHAAARLGQIIPMMMTPAGTLMPARVFVIGAGVAGLQAIATAKRLGARVEAFDTRPVVEEQVKSLGAKFLKIDLGGETGQTKSGYAQALTPEQIARQQAGMTKACAQADIVITTAKLFGRRAPRLVTAAMLAAMKPGSVVADLALETGGNVEGAVAGQDIVTTNGVTLLGHPHFETAVPTHATQAYASNLAAWITHFYDSSTKALRLDLADEILRGCLITHDGAVVHPQFSAKPAAA